ncbi:hypothetical protein FIU88_05690 [Halomonas sp. THAF12]|uniref:hypothetical protein n=1 Tax=Halomonas sp. THAF12 TaxID=2587849 RepID=UPI001268A583|nr:hypothetical protein [Halomonas sp. THAF12]QFT84471.1 hypothetical protein FIU88_05690 [Halomonas sp. THAF12]
MRLLMTALVAFFPLASSAADMPRFDVEAHCEQVAAVGGSPSNSLYNSCIDMEQSAYNGLKDQWSGLPANIQNHCRNVASVTGPGSYSLLESCVDMEVSAGNNRSEFSFD